LWLFGKRCQPSTVLLPLEREALLRDRARHMLMLLLALLLLLLVLLTGPGRVERGQWDRVETQVEAGVARLLPRRTPSAQRAKLQGGGVPVKSRLGMELPRQQMSHAMLGRWCGWWRG
jgi:hypothetical protein